LSCKQSPSGAVLVFALSVLRRLRGVNMAEQRPNGVEQRGSAIAADIRDPQTYGLFTNGQKIFTRRIKLPSSGCPAIP
jgi:hypothetical protein